jgi:hypothetical protein
LHLPARVNAQFDQATLRSQGLRYSVFSAPRMGATHFLTKTLPKVAGEMALAVLANNLTRVMNIIGIKPLIAAITA